MKGKWLRFRSNRKTSAVLPTSWMTLGNYLHSLDPSLLIYQLGK